MADKLKQSPIVVMTQVNTPSAVSQSISTTSVTTESPSNISNSSKQNNGANGELQCCGKWFSSSKSFHRHLIDAAQSDTMHETKLFRLGMRRCSLCPMWIHKNAMTQHIKRNHTVKVTSNNTSSSDSVVTSIQGQQQHHIVGNRITIPNVKKKDPQTVSLGSGGSPGYIIRVSGQPQQFVRVGKPIQQVNKVASTPTTPNTGQFKNVAGTIPTTIANTVIRDKNGTTLGYKVGGGSQIITKNTVSADGVRTVTFGTMGAMGSMRKILPVAKSAAELQKHAGSAFLNPKVKLKDIALGSTMARGENLGSLAYNEKNSPKTLDKNVSKEKMLKYIAGTSISPNVLPEPSETVEIFSQVGPNSKKTTNEKISKKKRKQILSPSVESVDMVTIDNDNTIDMHTKGKKAKGSAKKPKPTPASIDNSMKQNSHVTPKNPRKNSKASKSASNSLYTPVGTSSGRGKGRKKAPGRPGRPRRIVSEDLDPPESDSLLNNEDDFENTENEPELGTNNVKVEEDVPEVELNLFTLPSVNEKQISVLLVEPENPNFKVYASMDAIFVGDSALGDVTNQIGYITDMNNVVFVNPEHFLFPNVKDIDNFVPKQLLIMKCSKNTSLQSRPQPSSKDQSSKTKTKATEDSKLVEKCTVPQKNNSEISLALKELFSNSEASPALSNQVTNSKISSAMKDSTMTNNVAPILSDVSKPKKNTIDHMASFHKQTVNNKTPSTSSESNLLNPLGTRQIPVAINNSSYSNLEANVNFLRKENNFNNSDNTLNTEIGKDSYKNEQMKGIYKDFGKKTLENKNIKNEELHSNHDLKSYKEILNSPTYSLKKSPNSGLRSIKLGLKIPKSVTGLKQIENTGVLKKIEDTGGLKKIEDTGVLKKIEDTGVLKKIEDTGVLKKIEDTGLLKKIEDTGLLKKIEDTGLLKKIEDTGLLKKIEDTGVLKKIEDTGVLKKIEDTGVLKKIDDTGVLKKIEDTGVLKKIEDTGRLKQIEDTGRLKQIEDTAGMKQIKDTAGMKQIKDTDGMKQIKDTVEMKQIKDTVGMKQIKDTVGIKQIKDTGGMIQIKDTGGMEQIKDTGGMELIKDTLGLKQIKDTLGLKQIEDSGGLKQIEDGVLKHIEDKGGLKQIENTGRLKQIEDIKDCISVNKSVDNRKNVCKKPMIPKFDKSSFPFIKTDAENVDIKLLGNYSKDDNSKVLMNPLKPKEPVKSSLPVMKADTENVDMKLLGVKSKDDKSEVIMKPLKQQEKEIYEMKGQKAEVSIPVNQTTNCLSSKLLNNKIEETLKESEIISKKPLKIDITNCKKSVSSLRAFRSKSIDSPLVKKEISSFESKVNSNKEAHGLMEIPSSIEKNLLEKERKVARIELSENKFEFGSAASESQHSSFKKDLNSSCSPKDTSMSRGEQLNDYIRNDSLHSELDESSPITVDKIENKRKPMRSRRISNVNTNITIKQDLQEKTHNIIDESNNKKLTDEVKNDIKLNKMEESHFAVNKDKLFEDSIKNEEKYKQETIEIVHKEKDNLLPLNSTKTPIKSIQSALHQNETPINDKDKSNKINFASPEWKKSKLGSPPGINQDIRSFFNHTPHEIPSKIVKDTKSLEKASKQNETNSNANLLDAIKDDIGEKLYSNKQSKPKLKLEKKQEIADPSDNNSLYSFGNSSEERESGFENKDDKRFSSPPGTRNRTNKKSDIKMTDIRQFFSPEKTNKRKSLEAEESCKKAKIEQELDCHQEIIEKENSVNVNEADFLGFNGSSSISLQRARFLSETVNRLTLEYDIQKEEFTLPMDQTGDFDEDFLSNKIIATSR
ncbi:unnamed protein product [Meganyctiphanes norvegica]|uniref:C2H2-type domain-containing protein n=1 Tax=Meganyctiphanes norvegica TaxID=48144 RepID=A0AAV2RIT0_MEGNR